MKAINVVTIMLMVGLPRLSWLPIGDGQQGEIPQARRPTSAKLIWVSASNSTALCNDFTRAGFFIRRNTASNNWIVFLEGGGLCYNTNTCNKRFFVSKVGFYFSLEKYIFLFPYISLLVNVFISRFANNSHFKMDHFLLPWHGMKLFCKGKIQQK